MYFDGISPARMAKADFDMFWRFFVCAGARTAFAKFTKRKLRNPIYAGHHVISQQKGNAVLKELMLSEKAFMFGRYGTNELLIAGYGLMKKMGIIDRIPLEKLEDACACCGFFSITEESVMEFSELLISDASECTIYGTFRMIWEDYFISHYMPKDVILTHLNMMDFWRYDIPFMSALKGKKVLVIHP